MSTNNTRQTEHAINPLFTQRWSPRAFSGETIPDEVLFGAFEAARWAPSASNAQPWRFIYSKNGSATWVSFLGLLNPGNQQWAAQASALIVLISKKTVSRNGEIAPSRTHSFDSGAAWQNLALQATLFGWSTHGIGGFDRDKARAVLKVPEDFHIEAVIAIGKQADKSELSEELQKREIPNSRQPLKELILEGGFHQN